MTEGLRTAKAAEILIRRPRLVDFLTFDPEFVSLLVGSFTYPDYSKGSLSYKVELTRTEKRQDEKPGQVDKLIATGEEIETAREWVFETLEHREAGFNLPEAPPSVTESLGRIQTFVNNMWEDRLAAGAQ